MSDLVGKKVKTLIGPLQSMNKAGNRRAKKFDEGTEGVIEAALPNAGSTSWYALVPVSRQDLFIPVRADMVEVIE